MNLAPRPNRVLDIGIGYVKFGFLLRKYLTYWNSPAESRPVQIDAIEAFPQYIGLIQRQIHEQIFIGDAREVLPRLRDDSYNLVLMVDVLEHFDKADGAKAIAECQRIGQATIVSTPQ